MPGEADAPDDRWRQVIQCLTGLGLSTALLDDVSIARADAAALECSIAQTRAGRILEIGTFVGVATAVMAAAAPAVEVVSVDPDLPLRAHSCSCTLADGTTLHWARRGLATMGIGHKVTLLRGYFAVMPTGRWAEHLSLFASEFAVGLDARPVIGVDRLQPLGPFDLVFVDGDHSAVAVHANLEAVDTLLASRGTILLHDVSLDPRVTGWGAEVRGGIARFRARHPDYALSIDGDLGFLTRQPPVR
ncbi:MAG: class I SAM-dependent methyltransferase [Vicinamibacterales bacterium]